LAAVAALDEVLREEWGRVLATLIGFLGDFDLAEEAAQEAFAMAADRWPRDGVPSNPRAWLMRTARNRATDRIRRDRALGTKRRRSRFACHRFTCSVSASARFSPSFT
jgi:RNA polymerase sigma-70 factor, ECF subfamily